VVSCGAAVPGSEMITFVPLCSELFRLETVLVQGSTADTCTLPLLWAAIREIHNNIDTYL